MPIINTVIAGGGGSSVIDPLNVTPSTSAQTITASGGVDGYSPVNVSAVDASIDANITAGNIKDGVSILGVTGNVVERNATFLTITPMTVQQITRPTSPYNAFEWVTVDAVDASIDANITAGNIKSGVTILGVTGNVVELNGETKTVTPQVYGQTLYPTAPKNGITEITVNAVTSSIDANITAGNIKKDVTILGVTGSYEGGTTPTGTITITSNGITDVTNYANADVQVPTTAPAHYIDKTVDANGKLQGGNSVIDLTGVNDIGNYQLAYTYYNDYSIAGNINFSSLTKITGSSACQNMFTGCTGITGVDLSNVEQIGLTGYNQQCQYMFSECAGITSINLSSLKSIIGSNSADYMFYACSGLTNVSIPKLERIQPTTSYGAQGMFRNCFHLISIDLPKLVLIGANSVNRCFQDCSVLTNINIPSVKTLRSDSFYNCFSGCSSLTTLSFPALSSVDTRSFRNAFNSSVSNITLHFPSNMQATIELLNGYSTTTPFGAASGTVLFDLPKVVILNGANSQAYERNPKDDTVTALSWRIQDGVNIDWTPYYTSGTTDPVVGDTIYSDAACTTPVTTISSIA